MVGNGTGMLGHHVKNFLVMGPHRRLTVDFDRSWIEDKHVLAAFQTNGQPMLFQWNPPTLHFLPEAV